LHPGSRDYRGRVSSTSLDFFWLAMTELPDAFSEETQSAPALGRMSMLLSLLLRFAAGF
jgi:hypothetical protein